MTKEFMKEAKIVQTTLQIKDKMKEQKMELYKANEGSGDANQDGGEFM